MGSGGQTRHVVFIINPKAGTHSKSSLIGQIGRYLDKSTIDYSIEFTEAPGHGYQLSKEAVQSEAAVVIAVGGDGTMNECASALIHTSTTLGLIPIGSGNGLARDLGYSMDVGKSIEVINHAVTHTIDCGLANGFYFFCTAGIGFDAAVSRKFQDLQTRGFQGYIKTALYEWYHYRCHKYRIRFNGSEIFERAFSITLANACQFGNNAFISPEADPGDGFIDLCIIKEFPKHQAFNMATRLFSGSIHKSRYTVIHRVKEVLISCPEERYFHLDGETKDLLGEQLHVEIVPGALRVLIPQSDFLG